ncbi:NADH:flavin oxidoreductase/NADH oxidase [Desertivirga arenae]|uniref:NADH:flavin oxidoreductase/NADH oxidase n=1 Tax=Desertivirga arenae TaxID=2810309 RepID=UPI001A971032|nr:NADH:flavin oxidoreductase/NADH oxidase [Pedobacter sp. SYSU D00823]
MSLLFSPLRIREVEFKNRIGVSPMCQYSSEDGYVNDWHLVHLGSRAVGGAGLIIIEAAAIAPEGRITPKDLGIWSDDHIKGLKQIVDFIHGQGSVAGIQLAHAGRKASTREPWNGSASIPLEEGGWQTLAPSAIPFSEDHNTPRSLSSEDLEQIKIEFQSAAKRAFDAGFKVVEIHAAHGYLLHEFLSPLSNNRADTYGGSFENRIKFLLEVVETVRLVWPADLPLFVRISATDWVQGGWTKEDSIRLGEILKTKEVDLLDCSTGGNVPKADIPAGPGYQVEFSEAVRKTGILTAAVGIITSPEQAESIISKGKADLVLLAREMLRDPYFPLHAAKVLGVDIPWPVQYERAKR